MLGTSVAIIESNKVLLTKREDFEVWCLPGGAIEPGESFPQAAVREAKEETGLDIEIMRLVGVFSRPLGNDSTHNVVFAAKPIGGAIQPQLNEVLEARFFAPEEIDSLPLLADHGQRIADALNGVGGSSVWWHDVPWPFDNDFNRQELYAQRARSGLPRRDFYLKHFGQIKPGEGIQEVE